MDDISKKWLFLIYRIPPEPSRYRVSIWRTLKESGAIYVQNSVSVLPDSPAHRGKFTALSKKIQEYGGEAVLMVSSGLALEDDEKLTSLFSHERNIEYGEVIEESQAFLEEIEKETKAGNFIYAELEENEGNLERLSSWLEKVKRRDFFGASRRHEAEEILSKCLESLNQFAEQVEREARFI